MKRSTGTKRTIGERAMLEDFFEIPIPLVHRNNGIDTRDELWHSSSVLKLLIHLMVSLASQQSLPLAHRMMTEPASRTAGGSNATK